MAGSTAAVVVCAAWALSAAGWDCDAGWEDEAGVLLAVVAAGCVDVVVLVELEPVALCWLELCWPELCWPAPCWLEPPAEALLPCEVVAVLAELP